LQKSHKKILFLALGIVLLTTVAYLWYAVLYKDTPRPKRVLLHYQAPITIQTDAPFPKIEAETIRDHIFAEGYLHAMYFYGELVKRRAIIQGQISQMAGKRYEPLDIIFFLLNFEERAEAILRLLSPEEQTFLSDYSRGINHWAETHVIPYQLRKCQPESWQEEHSLALLLARQWLNSPPMENELMINEIGRYYGKKMTGELLKTPLDSLPFAGVNGLPALQQIMQSRKLLAELTGNEPPIRSWSLFWPQSDEKAQLALLHSQNGTYSACGNSLCIASSINGRKIWGESIPGFPGIWSGKTDDALWVISPGTTRWKLEQHAVSADGRHFLLENRWQPFRVIDHPSLPVTRKVSPFGILLPFGREKSYSGAKAELFFHWQPDEDLIFLPFAMLQKPEPFFGENTFTGWVYSRSDQRLYFSGELLAADSLTGMHSKSLADIEKPLILIMPPQEKESPFVSNLQTLAVEGQATSMQEMQALLRSEINRAAAPVIEKLGEFLTDTLLQESLSSWNMIESGESLPPTLFHTYIYSLLHTVFADELEFISPLLLENIARDPIFTWELIQRLWEKPYSSWWDDAQSDSVETMRRQLIVAAQKTVETCLKQRGSVVYQWQWHKGRKNPASAVVSSHLAAQEREAGYTGGSPFSPRGQFFDYTTPVFPVYAGARWGLLGFLGQEIKIHYTDLLLPASSGQAADRK
jgi:hypothetical protein